MAKTIRAKFTVESVNHLAYGDHIVKMSARYSDSPEDNQFAKATPSGSLEMWVSNPDALDFLEPGKQYYLDFSEATS